MAAPFQLPIVCFTVFSLFHPVSAQRSSGDPIVAGDGGGLEDALACTKQPLVPLNIATLTGPGSILSANYEITSCSALSLATDGIGPCLFDLGFEGLELEDPDEDWDCTNNLNPASCYGLKCDQYHTGT